MVYSLTQPTIKGENEADRLIPTASYMLLFDPKAAFDDSFLSTKILKTVPFMWSYQNSLCGLVHTLQSTGPHICTHHQRMVLK